MKIEKVLNNNLVVSRNKDLKEVILRGKGIGFQKKRGDLIQEHEVERVYIPQNDNEYKYYSQIFSKISVDYLIISEEIIALAKKTYNILVSDTIMLSLCDHISSVVERYKDGQQLKNLMLWDIKTIYPLEFKAGKLAVQLINEKFNLSIEEDEAGFLAFYFVNARLNIKIFETTLSMTNIIKDILNIVESTYNIDFNKDDYFYQRFITHLKFFAQRLVEDKPYKDENNDLFNIIKNKYPDVYKCVLGISNHIYTTYNYTLNYEEILYLMLHLERLTKRYCDK